MLEKRGRRDVIQALSRHAIGYHSNGTASTPLPPSTSSGSEVPRRSGRVRATGRTGCCRCQAHLRETAGVLWAARKFVGPQSNPALRKLGIPVYLDEGEQVGVDEQPFWYGGLLYVFKWAKTSSVRS